MPQRGRKFIQMWAGTIIILIALLILNALQSYQAFSELVDNEGDANVTKSVLRTIKDLYAAVQDSELGMRGFFVSGDEMYLEGYFQGINEINLQLSQLKQFNFQLPGQTNNVSHLERLIVSRLQATAKHIEDKEREPNSIELTERWMRDSYASMKAISSLISAMESSEYAMLAQQSDRAADSREHLRLTILVANAVGGLLIILVAFQVRKALTRQRAENQRLETMVKVRTEELQHYSNELQRSNRELQDFAFVASHDLQEPLRKIQAFGDRIKKMYQGQLGEGEDYIDRMQSAAARMSRLIEDLLTFSRVSTRKEPFIEVDLNKVLADVLDLLEVKIEETDTEIVLGELPALMADASQMRQLFQNLIANAIKFTQPNTRPHIEVSCQLADSDAANPVYEIAVKDNGIGIEEQYLERIFTPFQRLHSKEKYEGTGIGLAICRRIVERHQGEIQVLSIPEQGTTFKIILPTQLRNQLLGHELYELEEASNHE